MSEAAHKAGPSVVHGIFTIERTLPHPPERVYAAWSDPKAKQAWFSAPKGEWTAIEREFDFRVGGRERLKGRWKSGMVTHFDAHYLDIVPLKRVVYSYNMHVDERKISVSLATIQIVPATTGGKPGTRMIVTEQGAFLDGYEDKGSREHGTNALMDALVRSLDGKR
ncbi:MAG: SRPBCC family protein [Clostridia bacterium]